MEEITEGRSLENVLPMPLPIRIVFSGFFFFGQGADRFNFLDYNGFTRDRVLLQQGVESGGWVSRDCPDEYPIPRFVHIGQNDSRLVEYDGGEAVMPGFQIEKPVLSLNDANSFHRDGVTSENADDRGFRFGARVGLQEINKEMSFRIAVHPSKGGNPASHFQKQFIEGFLSRGRLAEISLIRHDETKRYGRGGLGAEQSDFDTYYRDKYVPRQAVDSRGGARTSSLRNGKYSAHDIIPTIVGEYR